MITDSRTLPANHEIQADICIIGAGAAGITLAKEFINQDYKVCLLEGGGFDYETEVQALYQGEISGVPYYPLDASRLRYFGGTTNHWNGASRPLDEIDFKKRSWVAESGWPIEYSELVPYYERAQTVCELGPFAYNVEDWVTEDKPVAHLESHRLVSSIFQRSPPTRFGQAYREEIAQSENIFTLLHANVTNIETDETAGTVHRLRVASIGAERFWVLAKKYILATGGIENARLLLLSNDTQKSGLGNQHDLVGRYFMEHPVRQESAVVLPTGLNPKLYLPFKKSFQGKNINAFGFFAPSVETLKREKMLNCGVRFFDTTWENISAGKKSLKKITSALKKGSLPEEFQNHLSNVIADFDDIAMVTYRKIMGETNKLLRVAYWAEPIPNRNSRVLLSNEKDALGQNRVELQWRLGEQDKQNFMKMHQMFADELGRAGLGRLRFEFDENDSNWQSQFQGSFHHMGTTRMAHDPKKGVVDKNCQIHGISNMYIAGSSVFPTVGHANPTLTIVALAIKLADHLKAEIG